jgi:hypothetical protein
LKKHAFYAASGGLGLDLDNSTKCAKTVIYKACVPPKQYTTYNLIYFDRIYAIFAVFMSSLKEPINCKSAVSLLRLTAICFKSNNLRFV